MKILLTGGAGFIGQYLAKHLVSDGHSVTALDSLSPQVHQDPQASAQRFPGPVVQRDVADPDSWRLVGSVDAVVHLAAETGTGQSMYQQDRYHRVNVEGTRLAAEASARWGARLVSLSSRAVYGNGRHTCPHHGESFGDACCESSTPAASQETDQHCPVSVYGETKSLAEAALEPWHAQIPITSIRPQNVIGAGQALHNPYTGVLAAFLAMLREGKPLSIYGAGTQTRDFVHVEDLAALLAWAVIEPAAHGIDVLNCGSGVRTTLLELANYAGAASPLGHPGVVHVDVTRAGDIDHACADLTRLRASGAPMPKWSTSDAVADFISKSWTAPGADSSLWDKALSELSDRGLTS